jgi:thiamine pyrophosphate-dependent acetolactate synthase large subunit-like protein
MEMTGADIVVNCLAEEGVEHVFGYRSSLYLRRNFYPKQI